MTWEVLLAFIGLSLQIVIGGLGAAWWVVRAFWKVDVRLTRVEDALAGRMRDREQRQRSGRNVLRALHAVAPDNGD